MASAVGAGLGILLAIGLARLLGFSLTNGGLTISPRSFIVSIAVGTAVTVAAAPSRRDGRRGSRPMAALRDAVPEAAPVTRRRIVGGAIVAVIGAALLGIGLFATPARRCCCSVSGHSALFIGIAYLVAAAGAPRRRRHRPPARAGFAVSRDGWRARTPSAARGAPRRPQLR